MMFTKNLYKKCKHNYTNITVMAVIFVMTIVSVALGGNKFTLFQIETDLPRFNGAVIAMNVTIELDDYYKFSFKKSQPTHYCFRIHDGSNTLRGAYVYGSKDNSFSKKLRDILVKNNNSPVKTYIKMRISDQHQLLGELLTATY